MASSAETPSCASSPSSSSAWRPRPPRWPSSASPAPARSWWPRRSTRAPQRADKPFIPVNCAAISKELHRERAVRPREGLVHRRRQRTQGRLRGGRRRHALPRRDWRAAAGPAGQAAARARERGDQARGRQPAHARGRARRRRHQPRPARRRARGPLPRGPLLPAVRDARCTCRPCAAARATCSRWPSTSCALYSPRGQTVRLTPSAARAAAAAHLAGQHPRAAQRGAPRPAPAQGPDHRRLRPRPSTRR